MSERFVPGIEPPASEASGTLWFAFVGDRLVVRIDGHLARLPVAYELGIAPGEAEPLYLGSLEGLLCFALELVDVPAGLAAEGLRTVHGLLPDEVFGVAGRAAQIVEWDRTHRFCGRCGAPTERLERERARHCPACGYDAYPRLSPAVITLVHRGSEMLLGRGRRFPQPMYSTLAGFVEPGESLEEAVAREIREEAGVEVRDVRYFGSQPWPFPHQLMVGFTAAWDGGDIEIDEEELVDARWFTRDDLPLLPPSMSISRALIDWAIAELPVD